MNIGKAARASGLSAKMIRHYEAIGLVQPERRGNSYRDISPQLLAELRFIRHARDLAFPLEEVRHLLTLWRDRNRAGSEVRQIALEHVAALEEKSRSLQAVAESLRHLADHCQDDIRPECPIIEHLEGATA